MQESTSDTNLLLCNRFRARIVARYVEVPRSFWGRARLWIGKRRPDQERAILFHSSAVHTVGMRFAVDVVFLGKGLKVLEVLRGLKPFRGAGPIDEAGLVLMAPAGAFSEDVIQAGDTLEWVPRTSDRVERGAKPPDFI